MEVLLAAHPRIRYKNASVKLPAAKILFHILYGGHIRRIARKHPGLDRNAIPGHRKPNYYLRPFTSSVLAVSAPLEIIFLIYLKIDTGGIIKNQVYVQV